MSDETYSDDLYKSMKKLLKERISKKRYEHSKEVAKTAVELAETYGVDEDKAKLAGLLHDWDKGLTLDEVRDKVAEYGLDIDPSVVTDMPWLLHGPTGAASLEREFPSIPADVIQAIARHTSGARNMSPLDMIVYIADIIEPSRTSKYAKEIRKVVGKVRLEDLYFLAFKGVYSFLISQNRQVHPQTADVWNYLVQRLESAVPGRFQASYDAGTQLEPQPGDWVAAERSVIGSLRRGQ